MKFGLSATRRRIAQYLDRFVMWAGPKVIAAQASTVIKASLYCQTACFVEVWPKIADGAPVDPESLLYKEASQAIEYYLSRPPKGYLSPGVWERIALPHIYLNSQEPTLTAKKRYYAFVHKFRIAKTVGEFANIQVLINLRATEQFSALGYSWHNEESSVSYWKQKIDEQQLPPTLRENARLSRISSYLKTRIREGKRTIARSNYPKLDFSFSDLGAFIAVSGALLLFLGYLHVWIVNSHFDITYQQYFETSDYIAGSIDRIAAIFFGSLLAAAYGFLFSSTLSSYSTQSAYLYTKTLSARAESWILHFTGMMAFCALGIIYYRQRHIDWMSALIAGTYVWGLLIGRFCVLFFLNPLRALFFLNLVFISIMLTVWSSFREIERVLQNKSNPSVRTLEFADRIYSEPEWSVLAITSSFVIMRHQIDGTVRVLPKSNLKRIDSVPSATPPP